MNCRDIEPLLLAERDGVMTPKQHAELAKHVAACPACRQFRGNYGEAVTFLKTDAANVPVPDADLEWRKLRTQIAGASAKKRPLAPVIWFGGSLAAAAALLVAFLGNPAKPVSPSRPPAAEIARADFVEAGDTNASTMVYVDKDSGWLVVWASEGDAKSSG